MEFTGKVRRFARGAGEVAAALKGFAEAVKEMPPLQVDSIEFKLPPLETLLDAMLGNATPATSDDGKTHTWTFTPPKEASITIGGGKLTPFGEAILGSLLDPPPIMPLDGCALCGGRLPYEPMLIVRMFPYSRVPVCRDCQEIIDERIRLASL